MSKPQPFGYGPFLVLIGVLIAATPALLSRCGTPAPAYSPMPAAHIVRVADEPEQLPPMGRDYVQKPVTVLIVLFRTKGKLEWIVKQTEGPKDCAILKRNTLAVNSELTALCTEVSDIHTV